LTNIAAVYQLVASFVMLIVLLLTASSFAPADFLIRARSSMDSNMCEILFLIDSKIVLSCFISRLVQNQPRRSAPIHDDSDGVAVFAVFLFGL
jgi:hypothetical protein